MVVPVPAMSLRLDTPPAIRIHDCVVEAAIGPEAEAVRT
jgi:hypothetical protein